MTALIKSQIKAVELKADVQKKLARRFKTMPKSMSYVDKIHTVACSGNLGSWWKSLPSK